MMQATLNAAELTKTQFVSISNLVKGLCGINLHEGKQALVKARLNKRLRALGLRDFGQYLDRVRDDVDGSEARMMLDALSTNLTYFFREPRHFEILKAGVVPAILARHKQDRHLRVWSAGCSSGEEPYSIAIALKESIGDLSLWDAGILATDISIRMLGVATRGIYSPERLSKTPARTVLDNFVGAQEPEQEGYRIKDSLRRMVHFARLNLMDPWPMRGQFDVIFCRNVMIYFDKITQEKLVERFWRQLVPGGTLFIGHSESLTGIRHKFRYVQPTVYEKP